MYCFFLYEFFEFRAIDVLALGWFKGTPFLDANWN